MKDTSLAALSSEIQKFVLERDWHQFHSPKNLSMALAVEASELMEHFQWMEGEDSRTLEAEKLAGVKEEMADVLVYLLRMADELEVDLVETAFEKMKQNALKYPAEKVKGSSRKYTEY